VLLLLLRRSPRHPVRFLQAQRCVLLERLPRLLPRLLQRRALILQVIHQSIHLLKRPLRNPWFLRRLRLRLQQDLESRRLRRVREFRLDLRCSPALPLHNDLRLLRHLELPRRHQEPVRVRPVLRAVLLRKAKGFRFAPVDHRLVDSHVPARLRVIVLQLHLDKHVLVDRDPVCHCVREADLREDILSVPVAPANEVAGPIKDPSAANAPAQPAEPEFRKPNPASRFTRANLPRRAAVRSLRSAMRKANANSIQCVPALARAQGERRKPNLSRRYSASPAK
jgi:hypothetical protein